MEASNGIDLEHANGVLEKDPETDGLGHDVNQGTGVVDVVVQLNGGTEGSTNGGGLNSSEFSYGISANLSESKTSTKRGSEKKGHSTRSGPTTASRNQKASLSQSLSFPSKVAPANGPRKSTSDAKQLKLKTEDPHLNGVEFASPGSNGGLPSKQTNLDSTPATISSLDLKSSSADVTDYDNTSEALQDTTPRVAFQRKSTGSGFSFRLDERAERRKEFFLKLEEKIQAKEAEKTNLQAKSMENQEAEIKQLRKSLTFKAKPMPIFYKEPGPPKVELKKIPTTRAISPKLGRQKPSLEPAKTSSQVSAPTTSNEPTKSNGGVSNGNGGSTGPKKLNQNFFSKLPSQRSTITRPGTKLPVTKPKSPNLKTEVAKANAAGENANDVQEPTHPGVVESVASEATNTVNTWDDKGGEDRTVSLPNPDILGPGEVSVQG